MVKKKKNVKKKKIINNKKTKILKKHSKKSMYFNDIMANGVISNAFDNLFV
jgi:hypothetical protein